MDMKKYLLYVVIASVLLYFPFVICGRTFNPFAWEESLREGYCVLCIFAYFIIAFFIAVGRHIKEGNKKN